MCNECGNSLSVGWRKNEDYALRRFGFGDLPGQSLDRRGNSGGESLSVCFRIDGFAVSGRIDEDYGSASSTETPTPIQNQRPVRLGSIDGSNGFRDSHGFRARQNQWL